MAKYRKLTLEEISNLSSEFVDFLVVNGIIADDWEKIKSEDSQKAESIMEAFSDVVFEKILRNCRYIEKVSRHEYVTILCQFNSFHLVGFKVTNQEVNLMEDSDFKSTISKLPEDVSFFTATKAYDTTRESSIWKMLQDGFVISAGDHYLSFMNYVSDAG